jgi:hypothetical protein
VTITSVGDTSWRLGSAAVVLAFALDPLGNMPKAVVLAVVVLAALQVFASKVFASEPVDDTTNVALLALTAIIVFIAALEILHPNVPSLSVGLVGFRKSATFVLGIAIGLGWRGSRMQGLRLTWWCMFAAASISLIVHLVLPSIEHSIPRAASRDVSYIAGVTRMQGLLAGPFHVSLLGVFLVLSALAPGPVIRLRWLRVVAALVGLGCVWLSQVRTGFVALAIGAVVMMFATRSARQWVNRLTVLAALGILGVIYINPLTDYARQFPALRLSVDRGLQDNRFTTRVRTWSQGFDLLDRSPLVGFGSGSAGDTLDPFFAGGEHVTSHNAFLKYAVEGGVLQGLLFALLCIGLALAVRPRRDPTCFGITAGVPFLVFASTGAAVEAIPVSLGLAVILGLCARRQSTAYADGASATARAGRLRSAESRTGQKKSGGGTRV